MNDPGFTHPITVAIAAEVIVVIAIIMGAAVCASWPAIFGAVQ